MKTPLEWKDWCLANYYGDLPADWLIQKIQDDAIESIRTEADWLLNNCYDSLQAGGEWWKRRHAFLNPKPQDVK